MATINQLKAAGFDMAAASGDQRSVLEGLSDQELEVLTSVKERMAAATDVEGHEDTSGGWCW